MRGGVEARLDRGEDAPAWSDFAGDGAWLGELLIR